MKILIDRKSKDLPGALKINVKRADSLIRAAQNAANRYNDRRDALQSLASKAQNSREILYGGFAYGIAVAERINQADRDTIVKVVLNGFFWVVLDALVFFMALCSLGLGIVNGWWLFIPLNLFVLFQLLHTHSSIFRMMVRDLVNKFKRKQ